MTDIAAIQREGRAAADCMKNGPNRDNGWVRVCLIHKGSNSTPSAAGISRLVSALSIHFDGVGFGSIDTGTHYEIVCSKATVAKRAGEYINGWLAK